MLLPFPVDGEEYEHPLSEPVYIDFTILGKLLRIDLDVRKTNQKIMLEQQWRQKM